MVSRIGPKWSTSNGNDAIGSIRDTSKSTLAATGIKRRRRTVKVNRIPKLETVPWTPHVNSVKSPSRYLNRAPPPPGDASDIYIHQTFAYLLRIPTCLQWFCRCSLCRLALQNTISCFMYISVCVIMRSIQYSVQYFFWHNFAYLTKVTKDSLQF
mgnify:CR=1 FL=1